MFETFESVRNWAQKSGDDLARYAQVQGLERLAALARRALDVSEGDDEWNEWEYRTLDAVLEQMCAYGAGLPRPANTVALESSLDFIRSFPEGRRRQVRNLLAVFEAGSLLSGPNGEYRRFSELDDASAAAYLRSWEESRLPQRRAAFRALKSVCMIGYWSQPESWGPIGYSLEDNPGLEAPAP